MIIVVGGGRGHGHAIGPSPEKKNVGMRQKRTSPNLGCGANALGSAANTLNFGHTDTPSVAPNVNTIANIPECARTYRERKLPDSPRSTARWDSDKSNGFGNRTNAQGGHMGVSRIGYDTKCIGNRQNK